MAHPFTRQQTFVADTTVITAEYENNLQDGLAAVAIPGYSKIKFSAWSHNRADVNITLIEPWIAKDAGNGNYVGVPAQTGVAVSPTGVNSWLYVYAVCTNGVVTYLVSATAPEATKRYKTGDETQRYVLAVYCDGSGYIRRFTARDGRYTFAEEYFVVGGRGATVTSDSYPTWTTVTSTADWWPNTAFTQRLLCTGYQNSTTVGWQLLIRHWSSTADLFSARSQYYQHVQNAMTSQIFEILVGDFQWMGTYTNIETRILIDGFDE